MIEAIQQENRRLVRMKRDLISLTCPAFAKAHMNDSLRETHLARVDRGLAILAEHDAGLWLIERAQQQDVPVVSTCGGKDRVAQFFPQMGIVSNIGKDRVMVILHGGNPDADKRGDGYVAIATGHELRHAWQDTAMIGATGNGKVSFHPLQKIMMTRFYEGDACAFQGDVAVGLKAMGEEEGFHEMMADGFNQVAISAYFVSLKHGRDIALRRAFDARCKSGALTRSYDNRVLGFCEQIIDKVTSRAAYEEMQLFYDAVFVPSGAADIPDPEVLGQTPWGTNYLTGTDGPDLQDDDTYSKLSWRVARRLRRVEQRWDKMVRTYG